MTNNRSNNMGPLQDANYTLGRTAHETKRLIEQSKIYGETTRHLCIRAGIKTGMSVLDIGSGAGDVALTVAELVGKTGKVTGVDVNPEILQTARQRTAEAGKSNIQFIAADARTIDFNLKFDALIGRFVLMYMANPAAALKKLITHIKPNGIIAFQEPEYTLYPTYHHPDTPLMKQLYQWIVDVFNNSGAHLNMGMQLYQTFIEAGLPPPEMHLHAPIGAAEKWDGYRYMTTIFQSLLPLMQEYQIATAADVDIQTLAKRLRTEVLFAKRPFFLPFHITAHARFMP